MPSRGIVFVLITCWILATPESVQAQRKKNPDATPAKTDAPTIVGQVVAYEPGKSITVENRNRKVVRKGEFVIVKDKTKIELPPRVKEIAVGMQIAVWADKDDPKVAARIGQQGGAAAAKPRNKLPNMPVRPLSPSTTEPRSPEAIRRPLVARPPVVGGLTPAEVARQIDHHVQALLTAEKVPASPMCDDAEFVRRVYLDIIGVIPPADKATAFLDSRDPAKRAKLIDELLRSPQYGLHFADLWCDRINVKDMPVYREPFIEWMADSLNQGSGWDEIVFDLTTAEGRFNFITRGRRLGSADPQALFILLNTEEGMGKGPNPAWLAAESGRLFLGVQLQCAECHNHPFTPEWEQTDFWGMAAFFGQLRSERVPSGGLQWKETPAAANQPVSTAIPQTALKNIGKIVPARLLGNAKEYQPADQQLLRHSLARWMTSAENPFFAKATVNRMWAHLFGRGLVNPVDDLRADNPPSHPAILELLAGEFKKTGFDLKILIRCICLSQAYQRTSAPLPENEQDQDKYSHMAVKVMSPGVFYDSLKMATGFPELKVGLPERKTKLTVLTQFTPREVFVDFFRSAQGEEADPLENTHGIPQALKLMNTAQLNGVAPVVQRLAASGQSREQMIEQLYLATLARRPSGTETKLIGDYLARRKDVKLDEGYSAVLWTLINSAEFVSNR
jgi:hypothetical protein